MKNQHSTVVAILATAMALISLPGCSSSHATADGAPDGPSDGGAPNDAGSDAGVDAGSPDSGVDSGMPDAGVDAGPPALPDAGPPPCEPGETRTEECGFCGSEAQICGDSGAWVPTSECLGVGECAEGTVETRDLGLCAQEQRICLDGCTWSAWEEIRAAGQCEPGDTRRVMHASCPASERLVEMCNASCTWDVGVGTCVDPCGPSPLRTTPEWEREVCVPDGEFVRGLDGTPWEPEATIYISTFYIDVYPVTYRRYQQCVDAGACTPADGAFARTMPEYIDYPVQGISRNEAVAFCAWDGGRRLVTAAEWQKAARGPAPRRNRYPWGDVLDCSIVDAWQSPCDAPIMNDGYAEDPYDAFTPAAASYYGVQMMGFGIDEWVLDAGCLPWYTTSVSRVSDPLCDPAHPNRNPGSWSVVGGGRDFVQPVYEHSQFSIDPDSDHPSIGFRCSRRP